MCVSECESLCLGCAEWDKGSCLVFVLKAAACPPPRWLHFLLFSYLSLGSLGPIEDVICWTFLQLSSPLSHKPTHTPLHPHFRGDYLNGCSTCLFVFSCSWEKYRWALLLLGCAFQKLYTLHMCQLVTKKVGDKKGDVSVQECEMKTKTCLHTLWVQQHPELIQGHLSTPGFLTPLLLLAFFFVFPFFLNVTSLLTDLTGMCCNSTPPSVFLLLLLLLSYTLFGSDRWRNLITSLLALFFLFASRLYLL